MKLRYASVMFSDSDTRDLTTENASAVPIATDFDDIYFSKEDGIAESDYVFFEGNRLWSRWLSHHDSVFVIAETGFGSGLNIALTVEKFALFRQQHPQHCLQKLHVISFELHPIAPEQLTQIASQWPQYNAFYRDLIRQYPPLLQGLYRMSFTCPIPCSDVTLDLVLGDINQTIEQVAKPQRAVDAWFLDGFAPSKNAAMWQHNLFFHINRLSHIGTTIATFTCAGLVKRGLLEHGFTLKKLKGFGSKREMLTGTLTQQAFLPKRDYYARTSIVHTASGLNTQKQCAVIGAGIAGVSVSLALLRRGYAVTLYCKSRPGDGASGNLVGGLYPQLHADYSIASQFYWHCFHYAVSHYRQLSTQQRFKHDFCGALLMAFNPSQLARYQKMQTLQLWPETLAKVVDQKQASQLANIDTPHPALYLPTAGWISPLSLVNACVAQCHTYDHFTLQEYTTVDGYQAHPTGVTLELRDHSNRTYETHSDMAVFALGADSPDLVKDIDFRLTKGQVEFLPTTNIMQKLSTLICHKGYFTPAVDGFHAVGSTYHKGNTSTDSSHQDTADNINTHKQAMPSPPWIHFLDTQASHSDAYSRASVRCSTPDHLPLVGNSPNIAQQTQQFVGLTQGKHVNQSPINQPNCFVFTGLGSRGLTTAPLCAEVLASQIDQDPLPLPAALLDALSPNRYLLRQLKVSGK